MSPSKHIARDPEKCGLPSSVENPCEFFNFLVNHIGDELLMIDQQGKIVYANKAAAKGMKQSRRSLLNKPIMRFMKEKMSLPVWQKTYFYKLRAAGKPITYVIERVLTRGETQTIEITATYIKFQKEGFVLSVARDITRQITIQKKLEESEDLYRFLSEGARDGIVTLDLNGRIVYANHAMERLLRTPLSAARGRPFQHYIEKESLPTAMACFEKARRGELETRDDIKIVDKRGTAIPIEVSVTPLRKEGKLVQVHMVVRDIRNRRKLEEMIRQSERLRASRLFLSGTAEEIRNPLLGIFKRTTGLLKKYGRRDFEYLGYRDFREIIATLENINAQIKYCYQTADRLLGLSQRKAGIKAGRCQAEAVIHKVLKAKTAQMEAGNIRCRVHIQHGLPPVSMGEVDLEQVLNNVVENAIQAMPAGGVLQVAATYNRAKNIVEIFVIDNGIGIPQENLPYVFEAFFTTKQRGILKNSGLGLPIAYSIVKSCQGDILIKSSLRKGTRIHIQIPALKK